MDQSSWIEVIGFIVIIAVNGIGLWKSIKISKETNYINAINTERRISLNKLRESFIEYNRLISYYNLHFRYNPNPDEGKMEEAESDIQRIENESSLLLNPSENNAYLLSILQTALFAKLQGVTEAQVESYGEDEYDFDAFYDPKTQRDTKVLFLNFNSADLYRRLVLVQKIILKTEWNMIKMEAEKRSELNTDEEDEAVEDALAKIDPKEITKSMLELES